ncbi:hypothetical protein R9C00_25615 [Flammeovirgaceae bacterium SG7u.111]|nr:hypothetical protein [Flammeovirgaceae bacterium SG7u.132]WPO35076.1 hypothetical protein R9C00_25615 [Flammeovirgaceae bacterium SG7u.111]
MLLSPGKIVLGGDSELKIFTWADAFEKQAVQKDITDIINLANQVDSLTEEEEETDSVQMEYKENPDPNIGKKKVHPIQYASDTVFPLDNFFASLVKLSSSDELIRILHYGDSQLEGDRMSDYLRNRFQKRFGGCGVGLVPVTELEGARSSLYQEASPNWVKYATYGIDRKQPKHKNYGVLGSYFTFDKSAPNNTGEMKLFRSKYAYKRFNVIENFKVLLRNKQDEVQVVVDMNGKRLGKELVAPDKDLTVVRFPVEEEFRNINVNFMSQGQPDIYGIAMDCNRGIALDNIAMRGSSGTEFTQISRGFYKEQIEKLNVKFLILQFGVNVIPSVLDDYGFYEYSMTQQLKYLKSLSPDLDILVIGVSDMSRKNGTKYETYPNVELVRDAQKNAAFKAGCAFWDLYDAMGGENSMVSWVNADPPLASTDYTHFTRRGAGAVAEMVYNEIIAEYIRYKKRKLAQ